MSLAGNAARWALQPLRRALLSRRVRRLVLEELDGLPLVVLPDVLNPVVFRTGALLARTAARRVAERSAARQGTRLLDLGCGTGVVALLCARAGAGGIATDVSPEAVRNARLNLLLNRLERLVEVREGDLFAPVEGERFDLVAFNPPFFPGTPRDAYDRAWRSEDAFERFCSGLPRTLAPGGEALALLSSHADEAGMRAALSGTGLAVTDLVVLPLGDETLRVVRAAPPETA